VGGGVPVALSTWPLASCDALTFANAVQMLPAGFNPTGTDTDPPQGSALAQDVHDGLQSAFGMAPLFLKTLLCGLDGVYVTPTASPIPSWGYRNWNNKKRYVAIPESLWSVGAPPR